MRPRLAMNPKLHGLLFALAAHSAWCVGENAGATATFVAPGFPAHHTGLKECCPFSKGPLRMQCRTSVGFRRKLGGNQAATCMNAEQGGGERFVSRKLTEALQDMSPGTQPTPTPEPIQNSATRPSKRAMVRKALTNVVSFFFRRSEPPPLMGDEWEASKVDEYWSKSSEPAEPARMTSSMRLAAEKQAESDRVFDLLNKYSQRHSDGTVQVTTTISEASERKPPQRSKYANLYNPEKEQVRKSKSGKLLQKSKYADVWSAQDQTRPDLPPKTTKTATPQVPYGTKPALGTQTRGRVSAKQQQPEEPPSRLEQLMNRLPSLKR